MNKIYQNQFKNNKLFNNMKLILKIYPLNKKIILMRFKTK